MTKIEFQDYINRCDLYLRVGTRFGWFPGMCAALYVKDEVNSAYCHIRSKIENVFNEKTYGYWCDCTKENIPVRLTALRLFEQVCLDEKLYREW